ncbi:hypothetical protein BV22DRAFT_1072891 [Leucogyrophana mollusca]|uniref:Uncharacterized protein n=1 Tax=Leucogyrophana mollusca TaxID=85980 RepID=A0ACB8B736_9AGAM|nr:hypothetical protein BV22DRAFT_1072891 [Leucogyrophana mollusca]
MSWPFPDVAPLSDSPESDLASLSPRTALLSPPYDNDRMDRDLARGLDRELGRPRRVPRGPGEHFRHERERAHSAASPRDLMRLLVNEEYESKQTRKVLYTAFDRLESESQRATNAEKRVAEVLERARAINEARVAAQQEAARTQEELKLYKLQLDNAQREILKAQDVLKSIEAQRDEAESAAARARSTARRLNEERLVEIAREEGRRLGFEEGVRRGRKLGYREGHAIGIDDGRMEMRDVAEDVLDRVLDRPSNGDEAGNAPVISESHSTSNRPAPEVLRVSSPVPSSLDPRNGSSRRRRDEDSDSSGRISVQHPPDPIVLPVPPSYPLIPEALQVGVPSTAPTGTSRTSRRSRTSSRSQQQQPQAWPMSDSGRSRTPPDRPVSVQNSIPSVHHSDIHVPPEGYIPTLDSSSRISLPPPHEMGGRIPSPKPSLPVEPPSPSIRTRDYAYDPVFPPPRRSSPESQSQSQSTHKSQTSSISQLDLVGLPDGGRKRRHRSRDLSVIHEDVSTHHSPITGAERSMRSERMTGYTFSQTAASTSQGGGRTSYRSDRDSESLASALDPKRDRHSNQRLADELRYSDPTEVEEWRKYGAENARSQSSSNPPRRRPVNVTKPTPLSPPNVTESIVGSPRHRRTQSSSQPQYRPESSTYSREHRRAVSSDGSVPDIFIQPPSGPPSDAPEREGASISGMLSPDHANRPLPIPAPDPSRYAVPLVPTVPNTPVAAPVSLNGPIYDVLPDGQLPPGFLPSPQAPAAQINTNNTQSGAYPRQNPSYVPFQPDNGRPKSGRPIYAAAPVPSGVSYPAPPIVRAATPSGGGAPSSPRSTLDDHRRSNSMNAGATPSARSRTLESAGDPPLRIPNQQSNRSRGSRNSYSRYDPSVYNDPAYLSSSESLLDPLTGANTIANAAAGSVRTAQIPVSPSYTYRTLSTNQ